LASDLLFDIIFFWLGGPEHINVVLRLEMIWSGDDTGWRRVHAFALTSTHTLNTGETNHQKGMGRMKRGSSCNIQGTNYALQEQDWYYTMRQKGVTTRLVTHKRKVPFFFALPACALGSAAAFGPEKSSATLKKQDKTDKTNESACPTPLSPSQPQTHAPALAKR
jgi:hypothetical protein